MFAVGEARHVQALARTNAFESLTPRLAYEVDRQTASKQADTVYATNTMSARWDNFEGELGSHWAPRQIALEQLHAGTVNRFIASPAFGVGRMTHMADERWLDRGNDPPLPQPRYAPRNDASPVPGDVAELAPADLASRPQLIDHAPNQFDFWDLHKNNLSDFLAPTASGLCATAIEWRDSCRTDSRRKPSSESPARCRQRINWSW